MLRWHLLRRWADLSERHLRRRATPSVPDRLQALQREVRQRAEGREELRALRQALQAGRDLPSRPLPVAGRCARWNALYVHVS